MTDVSLEVMLVTVPLVTVALVTVPLVTVPLAGGRGQAASWRLTADRSRATI